jgi:hypothetical protein
MSKNLISICSTAYRPENWMSLYRSIGKNSVAFELVFVGPNYPKFELPKNFHFIQSNVKPSQCYEVAVRNANGNFILHVADDCLFLTENPLDKLLDIYNKSINKNIIVSPLLMENGTSLQHAQRFNLKDRSSPLMPVGGLISKDLYFKIGGVDRNFIAVMFDMDIAMRVYEIGGEILFAEVFYNEDKKMSQGSNLCGDYWSHDRGYLDKLWFENGQVSAKRKYKVKTFIERDILNSSQGPRGRWRGSNNKYVSSLQDLIGHFLVFKGRFLRAIIKPKLYYYHLSKIFKNK